MVSIQTFFVEMMNEIVLHELRRIVFDDIDEIRTKKQLDVNVIINRPFQRGSVADKLASRFEIALNSIQAVRVAVIQLFNRIQLEYIDSDDDIVFLAVGSPIIMTDSVGESFWPWQSPIELFRNPSPITYLLKGVASCKTKFYEEDVIYYLHEQRPMEISSVAFCNVDGYKVLFAIRSSLVVP